MYFTIGFYLGLLLVIVVSIFAKEIYKFVREKEWFYTPASKCWNEPEKDLSFIGVIIAYIIAFFGMWLAWSLVFIVGAGFLLRLYLDKNPKFQQIIKILFEE